MVLLDGHSLTIENFAKIADGAQVELSADGLTRMDASRAVIERLIDERRPVYGVTTGLGARSGNALDAGTLAEFSYQTLRGRAHAIGAEDTPRNIRAGLVVRLNTLLTGHSGARREIALHLADCLNAGLTPVVGQVGSIGASDLVINATAGMALIGEGQMRHGTSKSNAAELMAAHKIAPLTLAPRDGLALANHSGATVGLAALGCVALGTLFAAIQSAAALSLEAFQANLSPLAPAALNAKPLPGQTIAADDLRDRLQGSHLFSGDKARRLQDPLSLRNIVQIHGGLATANDHAKRIVSIELNASSDNPMVLVDADTALSTGAYFTTELALACEGAARAYVHLAMAQVARIAKLLDPAFSDLPLFLARAESGSNGFAPLMKSAEALVAEIAHLAQPPAIWPSLNANGVEDCLTTAPVAARALQCICEHGARLAAIELMVAAEAVELRGIQSDLGPLMAQCRENIRRHVAPLGADRPLANDVEALAVAVSNGLFA